MARQNHSTGTPWESRNGYSRAVRVGAHIFVAGTTAADATGAIQHPGDAAAQTRYVLAKIEAALVALGATRRHVVRTRMFLTRPSDADAVGAAHGEFFSGALPVATLVVVAGLVSPDMLVEIEADAMFEGDEA